AKISSADRAVSKIRWSDDGHRMAVASSSGSLKVMKVADQVAVPDSEAAGNFYESMHKITQQKQTQPTLAM
ncbi:MAG: hypothetical protein KIT69_20245, partial [Propionibacteriaceae bacterium]|nr:hypothetical protein [Propionibacteriaceae bacterium]